MGKPRWTDYRAKVICLMTNPEMSANNQNQKFSKNTLQSQYPFLTHHCNSPVISYTQLKKIQSVVNKINRLCGHKHTFLHRPQSWSAESTIDISMQRFDLFICLCLTYRWWPEMPVFLFTQSTHFKMTTRVYGPNQYTCTLLTFHAFSPSHIASFGRICRLERNCLKFCISSLCSHLLLHYWWSNNITIILKYILWSIVFLSIFQQILNEWIFAQNEGN